MGKGKYKETGDWRPGDTVEYNAYGSRFTAVLKRPSGGKCWRAIVITVEGKHELGEEIRVGDKVSVVHGHSVKIESRDEG